MKSMPLSSYSVDCGISPEREPARERTAAVRVRLLQWRSRREADHVLTLVNLRDDALRRVSDAQLDVRLRELRSNLRNRRTSLDSWSEILSITREMAARSIDQRPFDEQIFGAFVLLRGGLAEMATGGGKTLTVALAAAAAAASGTSVHVLSSNEYLVSRDAQAMEPLYRRMKLSVDRLHAGNSGFDERIQAYRNDVLYATPHELAFDYLRDRSVLRGVGPLNRRVSRIGLQFEQRARQRGLNFAIVDEADEVMIDQACAPFVLSDMPSRPSTASVVNASMNLARRCAAGRHFEWKQGRIRLTIDGRAFVTHCSESSSLWPTAKRCHEWVERALSALHGMTRDVDYVVVGGVLNFVERPTGRREQQQRFERGLLPLLEAKEGLISAEPSQGDARIAVQALFRRYRRLAAISGTATEARSEFGRVFGLPVIVVPSRFAERRESNALQCHRDDAGQTRAILERVEVLRQCGRPVLIATRSVEASNRLAAEMRKRGIDTQLLDASNHTEEARLIAQAGRLGRVTIATNMAGRGTAIALDPDVAERGGLHVICARVGESRRADRQIAERCGRPGDSGSCEAIVSLADPRFVANLPAPLIRWAQRRSAETGLLATPIARAFRFAVQLAEERRAERTRRALLAAQDQRDTLLALYGKSA